MSETAVDSASETFSEHLHHPVEDLAAWETAAKIHCHGCMKIVHRIPSLACRWRERLGLLEPDTADAGYLVNFADVHRMYIRKLQQKLIRLAMHHQFDTDHGVSVMEQWRPALREFSMFSTVAFHDDALM